MDEKTASKDPVSSGEFLDGVPPGVAALFNVLERKGLISREELLAELRRLRDGADERPGKKCPYCAGAMARSASACPDCGRDFPSFRPDPDPYVVRD